MQPPAGGVWRGVQGEGDREERCRGDSVASLGLGVHQGNRKESAGAGTQGRRQGCRAQKILATNKGLIMPCNRSQVGAAV